MDIVTSRDEIISTLLGRVTAADPTVSVVPGTPVYDLLVNRMADVIKDERDLVNVLTNIARVVPMFGEDGKLRPGYEDMADHITERFFLTSPELNEVWDTLYLRFNKIAGFTIKSGSRAYFGETPFHIFPEYISGSSPLWRKVDDGYIHPVRVNIASTDSAFQIPAGSTWGTGLVDYDSDGINHFLLGGVSHKIINTDANPGVTLDYVRNSISNRSWSNVRSILYNLRSNTVFSPEDLRKARIMHVSEAAFIERRKVLYENADHVLDAVVSGDGKILMDYGTALRIAPVDLEYVARTSALYSEVIQVRCTQNPRNMSRYIQLDGITGAFSDRGRLYGRIIYELYGAMEDYTLTFELYSTAWAEGASPDPADRVCYGEQSIVHTGSGHNYINIRFTLQEDNSSGISGWCGISFDRDYFDVDGGTGVFQYVTDNFSLYRIATTGLGLLSPVAVGTAEGLAVLKDRLESIETADIIPPYMRGMAGYPSSVIVPYGDTAGVITGIDVTPSDLDMASIVWGRLSDKTVFWRIVTGKDSVKRFILSLDSSFRDQSKTISSTVIPDTYLAGEVIHLSITANQFMEMTVTFSRDYTYITDNTATGNYLAVPGSFVRVSNDEVVYAVSQGTGASNSADGASVHLLYYGTDRELLIQSQEAFLNIRHSEIGTRILLSPFRPFVFTLFYKPEYVSPFIEDRVYDTFTGGDELNERLANRKTQYVNLVNFLEEEFSNFTGRVSEINFTDLAARALAASGMTFRKLDFTMATQRGYLVRGTVNVDMDTSTYIDWTRDIIDVIEEEVDNVTQFSSFYVHAEERESLITDETLYKPLFSRVWL